MNSSEKVKTLIDRINEHSPKILKNNYDVQLIMETAFDPDRKNTFKDLIFTAKYVNGLKSVLENRSFTDDKFMEKMLEEFNRSIQKFLDLLRAVVSGANEKELKFFEEKYFRLEHGSLVSTMELIEDLSACKEYFNHMPQDLSLFD